MDSLGVNESEGRNKRSGCMYMMERVARKRGVHFAFCSHGHYLIIGNGVKHGLA